MARSGNRYVARELADRLGCSSPSPSSSSSSPSAARTSGPSSRPTPATSSASTAGRSSAGSRWSARPPSASSSTATGTPTTAGEPRVGGRCAVVATVGDVVVVAPHLESHGGPTGRARQVADLLDLLEPYADGRPVIVGGDLNTHTIDLEGRSDGEEVGESTTPHPGALPGPRRPGAALRRGGRAGLRVGRRQHRRAHPPHEPGPGRPEPRLVPDPGPGGHRPGGHRCPRPRRHPPVRPRPHRGHRSTGTDQTVRSFS